MKRRKRKRKKKMYRCSCMYDCVKSEHDLGRWYLSFLCQVTRNPVHIPIHAFVSRLASVPSWTPPGRHQRVSLLTPSSLEAADPKVNSRWALYLCSRRCSSAVQLQPSCNYRTSSCCCPSPMVNAKSLGGVGLEMDEKGGL